MSASDRQNGRTDGIAISVSHVAFVNECGCMIIITPLCTMNHKQATEIVLFPGDVTQTRKPCCRKESRKPRDATVNFNQYGVCRQFFFL